MTLLGLALTQPLAAQTMTGIAAVDSASVARAAYGSATRALREGRSADARRDMDRAASAWPVQPTYVWGSAVLAARAADTNAFRARLTAYADMGLGRNLSADTTMSRFLTTPDFGGLAARHNANRSPRALSSARATLADSTFWPEGMDVHPANGNLYVTSVRHRTIAEIGPDGSSREILPRHQPTLGAILAVRVDASRGVLWATTSGIPQMEAFQPADSVIAALLCIRISDGAIVRRVDLPVGQHVLGDVALSGRDVFFSDSRDAALYWLRASDDSLVRINSPMLRSPQGVAPKGDGRIVYVADYSHGLVRVDLVTRGVSWLGPAPGSTPIGLDGIVFRDESIIGIQNGVAPARVVRFLLDNSGLRIMGSVVLDQNSTVADEPTIGALIANEFLYVANSQWEKHNDAGAPTPGAHRAGAVILALKLSRP
jgi:DNA-binding beta-propeller fold protein YncE